MAQVFEEADGIAWELPTRPMARSSAFRVIWLLPVVPGDRSAYGRTILGANRHENSSRRTVTVHGWGCCGLVVTMTVRAQSLSGAIARGHEILFLIIEQASQDAPDAAVLFAAGRGTRFYDLERRWGDGLRSG